MESPRGKIGQYVISKKLGEGGMGAVFLGEHEFTGRLAAIKMISGGHFESEDSIQRLKDEARALGKMTHPNIVNVIDFFPEAGAFYLVLEFVNGVSLDKLFQVSAVNLYQAVDTAIKAGQGIAAAHRHGILHRDIKPQNVMISDGGEVKLMDFGLAKFADATSKTRTGMIMGTPRYMSPEQCRGQTLDARSDLYSFGVLVYRLACGREPFTEGDAFQVASKHVYERPPAPEEFNNEISPELSRIILKSLAKNPEERYTDLSAMLRELERERDALKQAGTADTAPLTAALALSQLQQAATGSPASGAAVATPGPRTPSGLRYTGVEKVDSAGRTTIGATRPPGAPSAASGAAAPFAPPPAKAGGKLKLIRIGGLVVVIAGIVTGMVLRDRGKTPARSAVSAPVNPANRPAAALPDSAENHWIRVEPPPAGAVLLLGVAESAEQRGFRPARRVTAPNEAFELQQHEVTWGELDPWLASHPAVVPATPIWLPASPLARKNLPVTGLRWRDAQLYCKSLGGSLPTEEQWEFAARGAALRPNAWGAQRPDAQRMRFFAGADGQPAPVMTSDQDRTPGTDGEALYDLTGNVQEWTVDLWREDAPGQDESWVQEGATSFRAIRGLPLTNAASANLPPIGAAWREPLCATGICLEKSKAKLQAVGFRCARNSAG